jgi:hypothetical protein
MPARFIWLDARRQVEDDTQVGVTIYILRPEPGGEKTALAYVSSLSSDAKLVQLVR